MKYFGGLMGRRTLNVGCTVLTMALAGCAGPISVKDVVADSSAYSSRNFSTNQLAPVVQSKLPAPGSEPFPFKKLHWVAASSQKTEGRQPTDGTDDVTLYNDNDSGLLRKVTIFSSNGINSGFVLALTYRDLWPLMTQTGSYRATLMPAIISADRITQWPGELRNIREHTSYVFAVDVSRRGLLLPASPVAYTCESNTWFDATQIMSSLSGRAMQFDCVAKGPNGAVTFRYKHVWLERFGIALPLEAISSSARVVYTYKSIEVDGGK